MRARPLRWWLRGGVSRRLLLPGFLLLIPACANVVNSIVQSKLAGVDQFGIDPGPPTYTAKSFVNWESPHVSPLALSADGSRLFVVNTPAARLEVFDVGDSRISYLRAVPVGLDPVTVRAAGRAEAWVANYISGSVSVVDVEGGVVTHTLQTEAEPTDIALTTERAFVVSRQRNLVEVFDRQDLSQPPQKVSLTGLRPRAAAMSPDGKQLYVAIFESGNGTTVITHDTVSDPSGPYGGQNPPPNTANGFSPAIPSTTPPAPAAGLIVKHDPGSGRWLDEQGADWSAFVTWGMHGHAVAAIDTQTLAVNYIPNLMNLNMQLAVRPDGALTVVGTEAFNLTRFEPNLTGRFVRSRLAIVPPGGASPPQVLELNPQLLPAYASGQTTLPPEERALSIADPRAIVWSADGTRGYVAGMGSNNVAVIDASGARLATFDVGQGPTGLALDEARGRLYVLDRFDADVRVYNANTLAPIQRYALSDPTPEVVRQGRPFLYNARLTSGLGVTACGACHVDGRMDQLAWDLGVPDGPIKPFDQTCDDLTSGQAAVSGCGDFHPLKGPMMTLTLQGVIGTEPFHWRGDRENLAAFNHAFVTLNGNDRELTDDEMAAFQGFLASIAFPPNPNRNRDNSLKAELDGGNPQNGQEIFLHEPIDRISPQNLHGQLPIVQQAIDNLGPIIACNRCHQLPSGTNGHIVSARALTIPQSMKVPELRAVYEKPGFDRSSAANNRGYGFSHDGAIATLEEFFGADVFDFGPGDTGAQRVEDVIAFLKSLGTNTHAGVGWQITLDASNATDPGAVNTTTTMIQMAESGDVGLVVHGRLDGALNGLQYRQGGLFEPVTAGPVWTADRLRSAAAGGAPLTWTVVPLGSQQRLGRSP